MSEIVNKLDQVPPNANVGYNKSFIDVDAPENHDLFAQLSYITNLSDLKTGLHIPAASGIELGYDEIGNLTTVKYYLKSGNTYELGLGYSLTNVLTSVFQKL